jgi:hypothetical protein
MFVVGALDSRSRTAAWRFFQRHNITLKKSVARGGAAARGRSPRPATVELNKAGACRKASWGTGGCQPTDHPSTSGSMEGQPHFGIQILSKFGLAICQEEAVSANLLLQLRSQDWGNHLV